MIYEFDIPHITDTKNLKKVFLKKKEVSKENVEHLERINGERKRFKENMKIFLDPKKKEKLTDEIYNEILGYSQSVEGLVKSIILSYISTQYLKMITTLKKIGNGHLYSLKQNY